MGVFSKFLSITCPESLNCDSAGKNPAFEIIIRTNGEIPFPQLLVHGHGMQLINGDAITLTVVSNTAHTYVAQIPADIVGSGQICIQVEGCRKADWQQAGGEDWVKAFHNINLVAPQRPQKSITMVDGVKVYFGIHKHMHQPYYRAADTQYWDGEKADIFGSRVGNYTGFVPTAVQQYNAADMPHAGLSTSWSGTLIEQLDRIAAENLCGDGFSDWNSALRNSAGVKTVMGNPRMAFSAFGFYHPLMALIPQRNIVRQIEMHREIIQNNFGVAASRVLFPPETAFHVRMIPALKQAGIEAVMYDSIHRYRASQDYPYAGIGEGLLPPNAAEQTNPAVDDWLQLHNIWAGSKISPTLLRPEYVGYEDEEGMVHKIIAVPAERYIGNEDARGGFGALQYSDVLGQVYDQVVQTGSFDAKHPPFFVLHSDGDNHGGGADSYYGHNTAAMLRWLKTDERFELTGVEDYLQRFPPNPDQLVHIEPGSWSGADNGDAQFMKWFSRYDQAYSPDLNSWAVLTALQNLVHTIEDCEPEHAALTQATRLMLTAETSCYWYWTGQHLWDSQVTEAANQGWNILGSAMKAITGSARDRTEPTIFAPWVTPENPGGQRWGQGCLQSAAQEATLHTFIYDVSGVKRAELILRTAAGEQRIAMKNQGPYPCQTSAFVSADFYTIALPVGAGDSRYYIEAEDGCGNIARSALERIFLA